MTNTNYGLFTFSKEGEIENVKVGTKIWYHNSYNSYKDVGEVIKIDSSKVSANWEQSGHVEHLLMSGFNNYWGIIMENKQEQKKHKYYDVILHWANGGEIQHKYTHEHTGAWFDFPSDFRNTPAFSNIKLNWRIKPKTKTIRYRNAMLKNNEVVVFTSEPTLEDAYGDAAFLRWIDPEWKEVEVEI